MRTFTSKTSTPRTSFKPSLKAIFAATALAAALGIAAPAFADGAPSAQHQHCNGGGHHGWHHRGGMMMHGLHQLDLSDAQKQSIRTAVKSSREGMKTQFQALMQQRRAFSSAVPGTPEFNSAYESYSQAATAATQERIKSQADLRTQIYGMLTDGQRAKLATLKAQHEQKRQAHSSAS